MDTLLKNTYFAVIDFETTNNPPGRNEIIEVGAVLIDNRTIQFNSYSSLVRPPCKIMWMNAKVTGITDIHVKDKRTVHEVFPEFLQYIGNRILVAQKADFEEKVYGQTLNDLRLDIKIPTFIDTMKLSKKLFANETNHDLDSLASRYDIIISPTDRHRAKGDCMTTAEIFLKQLYHLERAHKITTLNALLRFIEYSKGNGQVGLDFF